MAVKAGSKANQEAKKEESPPIPEIVEMDLSDLDEGFKVIEKEIPMPPFPAKTIRADKDQLFFDWMESLDKNHWNHLIIYGYREWPIIDRQKENPKAGINIDVYSNNFTREIILKGDGSDHPPHGSGRYQFRINDVNKAINGKGGTLGVAYVHLNDPHYPPVLRLEELLTDHPGNRSYVDRLVAEGKLSKEGNIVTQQGGTDNAALIALLTRMIERQSNQPVQPKDSTTESISKMYVDTNKTMMDMVKDQIKGDAPDKLIVMLTALKEMMPKPENNSSMLETLLKLQSEAHTREAGLTTKMFEILAAKPDSSDAEDKVLARIATYKELFGGEGGKETKKSTLEVILEHTAPIGVRLLDTLNNILSMKNYTQGLKQQQTQQKPVQQTVQELPQATQPIEGKDNIVEMPASPETQIAQVFKGPAGSMILNALSRGQNGTDFAAGVIDTFGPLVFNQVKEIGKEKILEGMKTVLEFVNGLSQIGATDLIVDKFITEFVEFDPEFDPETEEEREE